MFVMSCISRALLAASLLPCVGLSMTVTGNERLEIEADSSTVQTEPANSSLHDYFNTDGYKALQRFTATPARLDGKPVSYVLGMSRACENGLTPTCAQYVLANKEIVAESIADNPIYWESFAAYLATSPAVTRVGEEISTGHMDETISQSRIIEALQNWPVAQLLTTRSIDGLAAAQQLAHLRRWLIEKTVLADRMMAIASLGIQIGTANAALAIAARNQDREAIDALTVAIAPLTIEEMSLATALAGEIAFASHLRDFDQKQLSQQTPLAMYEEALKHHEFMLETYGQDYPEPQILTQLEFEELQREGKEQWQLSQSHWPLQIALSDASHDDFWGESAAWDALDAAPRSELGGAYIEYSYNARLLGLHMQVLRALRDHYVEGQPIAYPTVLPPRHFAWEWRENSDELCLVPVTVNRYLANKPGPACLPVWPVGQKPLQRLDIQAATHFAAPRQRVERP